MTEQLREIKKILSRRLKKDRYEHTIGVMYTAAALAMNYGEEIQAALTAGLLHDCGKYCSAEEQIQLCRKKKIALSDAEEWPGEVAKGTEMPFHLEQALQLAGGKIQVQGMNQSQVVKDRELITGQNPASDLELAKALEKALKK